MFCLAIKIVSPPSCIVARIWSERTIPDDRVSISCNRTSRVLRSSLTTADDPRRTEPIRFYPFSDFAVESRVPRPLEGKVIERLRNVMQSRMYREKKYREDAEAEYLTAG